MIDDQKLAEPFGRLKLQPKLFLDRRKHRRIGVRRGRILRGCKFQMDIEQTAL